MFAARGWRGEPGVKILARGSIRQLEAAGGARSASGGDGSRVDRQQTTETRSARPLRATLTSH